MQRIEIEINREKDSLRNTKMEKADRNKDSGISNEKKSFSKSFIVFRICFIIQFKIRGFKGRLCKFISF